MECINKYMKSTKEIKIHVNEICYQKVNHTFLLTKSSLTLKYINYMYQYYAHFNEPTYECSSVFVCIKNVK